MTVLLQEPVAEVGSPSGGVTAFRVKPAPDKQRQVLRAQGAAAQHRSTHAGHIARFSDDFTAQEAAQPMAQPALTVKTSSRPHRSARHAPFSDLEGAGGREKHIL